MQVADKIIELRCKGFDLEKHFRVLNVGFHPGCKWSCGARHVVNRVVNKTAWVLVNDLVNFLPKRRCDSTGIIVDDLGDYTRVRKEALHSIPGDIILTQELHDGAKHVDNRIRRNSKSLYFVKVRWLKLTDLCSCSVDFWLNPRKLRLNQYFTFLDDALVRGTVFLKLLDFSFSCCLLFH